MGAAAKRKPGRSTLTERQAADLLMSEISDAIVVPPVSLPPFPTIELKPNGYPRKRPTDEQTKALIAHAQAGSRRARDLLVVCNMGLVYSLINQFVRGAPSLRELRQEAVGEGVFGVIRAVELFDLRRDIKFSTYAALWIRAKVGRIVQKARAAAVGMYSLDEPSFSNDEENYDTLGDRLHDANAVASDDFTQVLQMKETVREALQKVLAEAPARQRPRWKAIIDRRLLAADPATLEDIAQPLELSREAIRLMERQIKQRLKQHLESNFASPTKKKNGKVRRRFVKNMDRVRATAAREAAAAAA